MNVIKNKEINEKGKIKYEEGIYSEKTPNTQKHS